MSSCTSTIQLRRTSRRLLLVLSDGKPHDVNATYNVAANDFMQAGFKALCGRADEAAAD